MRHNLQWQFSHSYTGGHYLKMLMVGWPRSILSNLGQEKPPSSKRISWSTPLHSSELLARSAGNQICVCFFYHFGRVKSRLIILPSKALPHRWQGGHLDWEQREGPAGESGCTQVFTCWKPGWRGELCGFEEQGSTCPWGCPSRSDPACQCLGGRSGWWTAPSQSHVAYFC